MSSASLAAPFHRSARAASLQSFSTRIGQANRAPRWPARLTLFQPGSGVKKLVWPAASTAPVTPTVTAQMSAAVLPASATQASMTLSSSASRSAGPASGGDGMADRLHDVAVEVGQQRQYLVHAHVDAEHVPGAGPELVAARGAADGTAGAGLEHAGPAVGDQTLGDDVDGGPGQPGALGQLSDGGRRVVAQGAHDAQGVELAQTRQVRSGCREFCHVLSLFASARLRLIRFDRPLTKCVGVPRSRADRTTCQMMG